MLVHRWSLMIDNSVCEMTFVVIRETPEDATKYGNMELFFAIMMIATLEMISMPFMYEVKISTMMITTTLMIVINNFIIRITIKNQFRFQVILLLTEFCFQWTLFVRVFLSFDKIVWDVVSCYMKGMYHFYFIFSQAFKIIFVIINHN